MTRPTPLRDLDAPAAVSAYTRYGTWLERQPLAERTKASYLSLTRSYLGWLVTPDDYESLIPDHTTGVVSVAWGPRAEAEQDRREAERRSAEWAVREYKRWMLVERRLAARTVNQALSAVSNFYLSRGLQVAAPPERLPKQAPQALAEAEVRALRRAAAGMATRDRAIILTFLYTGLRRGELAALRTGDLAITARKGVLTVRSGKGNRSRTVPIAAECRRALQDWQARRAGLRIRADARGDALWVSRLGNQLSARAIREVIARAGRAARIKGLTAHTLRHTFITSLVRAGTDAFLVADLAGHSRVETTQLYSLPTAADKARAVTAVLDRL